MHDKPWKQFLLLAKFGQKSAPKSLQDLGFLGRIEVITRLESTLNDIKDLHHTKGLHSSDGRTACYLLQSKLDANKIVDLLEFPTKMQAYRKGEYSHNRPLMESDDSIFVAEIKSDYVLRNFKNAEIVDTWFSLATL